MKRGVMKLGGLLRVNKAKKRGAYLLLCLDCARRNYQRKLVEKRDDFRTRHLLVHTCKLEMSVCLLVKLSFYS